jgi:dTMP kinase
MAKNGLFIVLEGNDGSGKTTQANLLHNYLRKKGLDVFLTREPSDSKYGKKIRKLATSEEGNRLSDKEWLELFTLDRQEHLEKEIEPALSHGKIVVCDRYDYSTCVYQLKNEQEWKPYLKRFLRPHLTMIIIVPAEIAMQRLYHGRRKIAVFEKKEMIEERMGKYLSMLSIGDNIKMIDGSQNIEAVYSQIKKEVDNLLKISGKA